MRKFIVEYFVFVTVVSISALVWVLLWTALHASILLHWSSRLEHSSIRPSRLYWYECIQKTSQDYFLIELITDTTGRVVYWRPTNLTLIKSAADQFQIRQTLLSGHLFSTARLPCWSDQPIQSVSFTAVVHTEVSVSSAAQLGHCCSSFLCCCSKTLFLWTVELLHLLTHLRPGLRHPLFVLAYSAL